MGAAEALGGPIDNSLEHAIRNFVELIVPDTENGPALAFEILVSCSIAGGVGMLASVQF